MHKISNSKVGGWKLAKNKQVKINVEAVNADFSALEWLMNAISGIKVM